MRWKGYEDLERGGGQPFSRVTIWGSIKEIEARDVEGGEGRIKKL